MEKYEFVAWSILVLWIVLPLIPAILIYWLFPHNAPAWVHGTLAGLTVKAGGAFAAYLIVLLVAKPLADREANQAMAYLHPVWTIKGALRVIDKHGVVSHPGETFFQKINIKTEPPLGSFADPTFTITVPEGPNGIPNVYLFIPDYSKNVLLKLANFDHANKTAGIAGEAVDIEEPRPTDSESRQPQTDPVRQQSCTVPDTIECRYFSFPICGRRYAP
jgi:hypothetical protein